MSETPKPPENDKGKTKDLTAAEAAKRVQRQGAETVDAKDEDGAAVKQQRVKRVAVKESEVLSFRDYGTHVVLVTTDGQKLSSQGE